METANSDEIAFYLERAREAGGAAIELGCGTGVLAVALALAGINVRAFDASEELIGRAVDRRQALGIPPERCHFERSDLRSLRPGASVGLVIATSDSLVTLDGVDELEALFATAHALLAEGGTFAFDIRHHAGSFNPGREARSRLELRQQTVRRPHLWARGRIQRLRILGMTPEEIEETLASARFVAMERWGGFSGQAYAPEAERMVVVCRPS